MEWVLVAAVVLIAAILLMPLRLFAGLAGDGKPRWFVEVVALGGLVRLGRNSGGYYWTCGQFRRALAPPAPGKAAVASPAARGGALAKKWGRLNASERRAFLTMLAGIWSAMQIAARGNIRYGFEDPAVTAWLHALHCIARSAGAMTALQAEPDFADAGWSGHVEAVLTVRPALVVLPAAQFFVRLLGGRMINKWTGGKRKWQVQT